MYNVYELVVPTNITIAADSRQQALEQYPNATEVNLVREGDRPWTEAIIRAKHLVGGKVVGYLAEFDASKDRMHGRILIEFYDEFYDESGKSPWFGKTFGDTVYVRKVGDNYHVTGDPTGEGGGWYVDGRRVVEDLACANSVVWYDEGHYQSMEEYKQSKPIIVRLHALAEPCGKAGSLQSNISDHRFATKEEADEFIQSGYKNEMYDNDSLVDVVIVDPSEEYKQAQADKHTALRGSIREDSVSFIDRESLIVRVSTGAYFHQDSIWCRTVSEPPASIQVGTHVFVGKNKFGQYVANDGLRIDEDNWAVELDVHFAFENRPENVAF